VEPAPRDLPPAWERWNDYGIGLLRKPGRGQLRQAEEAFRHVEARGSGHGPLNLARVYLREGRLAEAAAALERAAASPEAWPWVVTWLTARVDKQNGQLDAAIAGLRRILATDFAGARARGFDFSRDYVVVNELGQTLLERARQERGPARREARDALLAAARARLQEVLAIDPENAAAHYNLARIHDLAGDPDAARRHRAAHARYRPDDNARDRSVLAHRRANPAADHAAAPVVIHALDPPPRQARIARAPGPREPSP
jgi:tetratricopeptide (TPR) repeat protein